MREIQDDASKIDPVTVVAIAVVVYAATNVLHEGLGHGGACLFVHGRPQLLTAISFEDDLAACPPWAPRVVAAGGTVANLVGVALAAPFVARGAATTRFALWLFTATNSLVAAGYLLFSGMSHFGDWAVVMDGLVAEPVWRIAEMAIGGWLYFRFVPRLLLPGIEPFLGRGADRSRRGRKLLLLPYVSGGLLFVIAGFLQPNGLVYVLASAAAASLGGTSLLTVLSQWQSRGTTPSAGPVGVPRSVLWIVAAVVVAAVFIGVLGPGVRL